MKKKQLKSLSLSKKTISSLESNAISGGDQAIAGPDGGTVTLFWTPNLCKRVQTGTTCYSNNATSCPTGCATC